jgi:hypothetical protein
VGTGSKGGRARGGSGREMRDVGVSTAGCAGGRSGKGRWLTGGVRGPARASSRRAVNADRADPPGSERERACTRRNRHRHAGPTGQREGERERARGRRLALTGACQAERARARPGWARLGLTGQIGFFLISRISK